MKMKINRLPNSRVQVLRDLTIIFQGWFHCIVQVNINGFQPFWNHHLPRFSPPLPEVVSLHRLHNPQRLAS